MHKKISYAAPVEIIEVFVNLKGEHIKENTIFIGSNSEIDKMIIDKDPNINYLMHYLSIYDFYVTKSSLGFPIFNITTLLL